MDIAPTQLPTFNEINTWDSQNFSGALRHDLNNPNYNLHFRQLLHVGNKVAAEMGRVYLSAF